MWPARSQLTCEMCLPCGWARADKKWVRRGARVTHRTLERFCDFCFLEFFSKKKSHFFFFFFYYSIIIFARVHEYVCVVVVSFFFLLFLSNFFSVNIIIFGVFSWTRRPKSAEGEPCKIWFPLSLYFSFFPLHTK